MKKTIAVQNPFALIFKVVLLSFIAIFVQGSVAPLFLSAQFSPNLMVILIVFLAFHFRGVSALISVFLLGLQFDLFTGTLLGPWAGAFSAVFLIIHLLTPRLFVESQLVVATTAAVASAASSIVYLMISRCAPTVKIPNVEWSALAYSFSIEAIVSGICAPLMFSIIMYVLGGGRLRSKSNGWATV
jgi:rod shape-determining protein MreD